MVLQSDLTKLGDPEENYLKLEPETLLDKYRIPVQHFEYSYIETCKDGRELEKIVQVLRSGQEGYFPDLTKFAENRLAVIKPKSKLLTTACPVISKETLSKDERNEITNDLTQWISSVSQNDNELVFFKNKKPGGSSLPEVREMQETILEEKKKLTKRISATDYASWDKYDPDTELLKMELEEENLKKTVTKEKEKKKPAIKKTVQFKEFTTETEALHEANYEKDKGNDFFKAGDYKEALKHYTNSINSKPTLASFTNRALTNIKLKRFKNAIDDCHSALAIDPDNIKAFLRKAQALDGLGEHCQALETVEQAIEVDPNNALAQELAEKFRKLCGSIPKSTKRFVVHEIGSTMKALTYKSCNNDQVIIPIPGTSNMTPPHYITCSDNNPEKLKEEIVRANTPIQIVHLISVDNSDADDDDYCPVNHLKSLCSSENLNKAENQVTNEANKLPTDSTKKNEKIKIGKRREKTSKDDVNSSDTKDESEILTASHALNEKEDKISDEEKRPKQINIATISTNQPCVNNIDSKDYYQKRKEEITLKAKEEKKKSFIQQVIKEDKHAGGEPYIKDNEYFDIPQDIHSPYNFLKAWNSANIDKTLERHASILRSINVNRIVELIGCKLDNDMFSTIVKCLCIHFAVPSEVEKLHFILVNIVNLPRFVIISMLMSAEDRNCVNKLVNFLKQHGKPVPQDVLNKFFNY